jgi:hypothetical protein
MYKNMLRLEEKIKDKEGNNNDLAELISYYGVYLIIIFKEMC